MPWKETCVMDERTKFIGRLLEGEKMAPLCREFGISRVTGHRIWNRYRQDGNTGLYNRSRAPHKHPNQTPFEVEKLIIRLKNEKPCWGAPKIRELVENKYPSIKPPSTSTVHSILDRHDLVKRRRVRSKFKATASYLSNPTEPNDLWCTDFKGQFRMGNREYCYPLTLSDFASRYLFVCESLQSTEESPCFPAFEQAFKEYGLPCAIRSDNGIPFASGNSAWNLTKLSVWWIRLGIRLERIQPGNPQQNGRHERMHRTLKLEATMPAKANLLQQQEAFDGFKESFNFERPHQALDMKHPADVYQKSPRHYVGLTDLTYPGVDRTLLISNCGRICIGRKIKVHISKAFANQPVGLTYVDTGVWQVDFMSYTLGYFDEESRRFSPNDDPFGLRLDKGV
jgi:putative transposase